MNSVKRSSLLLLLMSGSFVLGNNPEASQDQGCPLKLHEKVSDHVIRMLARSKTLVRRSDDWQERIQRHVSNESTTMRDSFGPLAILEKARASFELKNFDGIITIKSELNYKDELKAKTEEQEQYYKQLVKDHGNEFLSIASDANEYTRCRSAIKINFDEASHKLSYELGSVCDTKMRADMLKAALESVKQREACFFANQHEECFLLDVLP